MIFKLKYLFVIVSFIIAQHACCWAIDKTSPLLTAECDSSDINQATSKDTLSVTPLTYDLTQSVGSPGMSLYALPYSTTRRNPNWHRMWINTAVLSGGFVAALFALELLPESETCWNREEMHSTPMYKRWFRNVFKRGPEWDGDKFYFNFILHPYAGSVYFMSARSCGFNMWQSLLYCACVSTIGWEFGVEAFNERPSYQDLFVTPLLGSAIGEGFYCLKRYIASKGYSLAGSKVLGNIVAFIIDPVNEVVGLFAGNDARHINDSRHRQNCELSLSPIITSGSRGMCLSATF